MSASIEEILSEATELEKEYEWLQASELYEQALGMVDEGDYFRRGEVQEKIGYTLHRAAFQAENQNEFLERLGKAVEAYEVSHGFYERVKKETGPGWILRSGAIAKYLEHWIEPDPSKKRRLLIECLDLERKALEVFWDEGDKLEYCRTYGELPVFVVGYYRTEDIQARRKMVEEGIEWGEKSVAALSELGDIYEIARSQFTLATCLLLFVDFNAEPEKQWQQNIEAAEHMRKAVEYSENVNDAYLAGFGYQMLAFWVYGAGDKATEYLEKALKHGEETNDNLLKGYVLHLLAFNLLGWARTLEDPDEREKAIKESIEIYDKAMHHLSIISYHILGVAHYVHCYIHLANLEIDLEKRREILDRSLEAGTNWLKETEDPAYSLRIVHHSLSWALTSRASIEPDLNKRRSMLERALEHREFTIEHGERFEPYHYWNRGIRLYHLTRINGQLADIEPDLNIKIRILEEAVVTREKGLELMYRWMSLAEKRGNLSLFVRLSECEGDHSTLLTRLYELTKEPEYVRRAMEASRKAIESASKLDLFSRIAELYWKVAKAQITLGEHMEAAESFKSASESYRKAAEKIPQLKEFYQDHAHYMQAWSEIVTARQHHTQRRYGMSSEHYEKAAVLHKSTERWNYLTLNYSALARLEESEDLSRKEQTEDAKKKFELAASLFREAGNSIQSNIDGLKIEEEKETAEKLVEASGVRSNYCFGRIALEEARILDRQGDHSASSQRYGHAVDLFEKVIDSMERESDKEELRPIVYLCKAWEKMMMAEARTSPELYNEAAELFEQARKHALDQPTSLLAHAHSSFSRALEAGSRFETNRDPTLFSTAKNHIEAATSHYLRAGYQTMSDYAGATSRLLDAYLYSYNAQTEADPKKKAQFYQMAERLLQSSAGAYLKAKHPEKSDEVRRILERVKEEREIAISLSEALHAPTIVATTSSFSMPIQTHERANGLERFDGADIQVSLIARRREVGVGEDLDLEIELVNAGKAPAQLVKVEDIVIEGFELKSYPDICRVEDSYLDMKGRSLSPLKTQELKLVLKPLAKGAFELKPRILYLDESGKYKSHEPEPISITVQELGIRGWLRGPTR